MRTSLRPGDHGLGKTATLVLNGCAVRPRRRVIVGEIIDHFLGPHRGRLGQDILVQRGADPRIRSGVDVDREGRDRRLADDLERVFGEVGELVAADVVIGRRSSALRRWHAGRRAAAAAGGGDGSDHSASHRPSRLRRRSATR